MKTCFGGITLYPVQDGNPSYGHFVAGLPDNPFLQALGVSDEAFSSLLHPLLNARPQVLLTKHFLF
jgi:hypothetical protein